MSDSLSNRHSSPEEKNWMKRMMTRMRDGRGMSAFGGSKLSNGAMIALVMCGLVAASLFVSSNSSKKISKDEGKLSATAASETKTTAIPAKVEEKHGAKLTAKKRLAEKKTAEVKQAANKESAPAESQAKGAILTPAVRLAPPVQLAKETGEKEDSETVRRRASWFFDQRAYPNKHIPAGALQKAIEQRDLMKQQQKDLQQRGGIKGVTDAAGIISFPGDALWHLMGPQPVSNPFGQNGGFPTVSGRVTAIAVDPTNASIVYIGGAAGGVWKTTNGGANWSAMTDTQPALAVGSIAIDPNSCTPGPCTTIYVGTGESNFNGDAFYGAGILKSINGGTSWTQLGTADFVGPFSSGTGGAQIGAIAVQPGNSNIVLASVFFFDGNDANGGVWRSTNGGTTWARPTAGAQGSAGTGVLFESTSNAGTTATAWAALGDIFSPSPASNGIWKSTDSGATWTKQAGGLPTTNVGRITLGYAAGTSGATSTVYAAIANSSTTSSDLLGLFKTVNGGTAWTALTSPGGANGFCAHQCFYDMAIGVSPVNANDVVLGGGPGPNNFTSLFESTNGGTSWTPASAAAGDFAFGSNTTHVHVDTHAIVFSATGSTLYVGDDGGMWSTITPTPAGGTSPTWVDLNAGLAITQFYPGVTAAVSDENYGFGGTQDNDTELFQNSLTWQNEFICGDGGFTAIDQTTPTTIWAACNVTAGTKINKAVHNGQFVTLANSQTLPGFDVAETAITNSGDAMQFIPPIAGDESNPDNLYFGTCRVWQTTNAASSLANSFIPLTPTWTPISGDLSTSSNAAVTSCPSPSGAGNITSMDVAPQNAGFMVAGTSNGLVWEAFAPGPFTTWTEIDGGLLPNRSVTAVRTKRSDSTGKIVYVTLSGFDCGGGCGAVGHVFKTTNGGTTWTNITGDLPDVPVNDIVVDHDGNPLHDALYIGTDVGVFACPNPEATVGTCANWTVIGDGLPNSPVLGLALRRHSRILRAATHGRSMWQIQLSDVGLPSFAALSSITPGAVPIPPSAGTTAVTVTGVNFSANTQVVTIAGAMGITTTFVNTTQLNVTIPNSLLQTAGVFNVLLTDPAGVDAGSTISSQGIGGLLFTVMNPLLDPNSMTPATAQTYTAVPFTFTSATATEPFLPSTVLAFYDTSNPPVFQFQLPTISDPAPTITGGGTTYKLTTAITDFTTPFTYQVVPYNPTPGGGIDALSLAAATNGAGPVPFTFTVTPNPNPLAIVSPNPIALFAALGTTSAVSTISITNPGGAALTITAQSITGTNLANFSFAAPGFGTTCNFPTSGQSGTGTITLAAGGGTCNFGMTYFANPATPGNSVSVATLKLTDNGSGNPQMIPITGTPFTSGFSGVILTPVNFGGVAIGSSLTLNATLLNGTAVALNVNPTGFTISGGTKPGDFQLGPALGGTANPCPGTASFAVPAFSSCQVGVTFTPSVVGNETSNINVADDGPASPQSAPLTGSGIEITSISPSIVATGGPAFTLTVNGGGFAPSAVVNASSINGTNVLPRLTTFVSPNQLLASIPASDIATAGSLAITVTTPVPGGTTSEPKTLVVAQASPASNDNINFAAAATTIPWRITEDTTQATVNTGGFTDPTPSCAPGTATLGGKAKSVWFQFKAPANGTVVVNTRFSSYMTILSAFTGSPNSLTPVAGACASGNVPAAGSSPVESLIEFNVTNATFYSIMVTDASAAGAGGTLTYSLDFQATPAPTNDDNAAPTVIASAPFSGTVNTILATANTNGHPDPALPGGCATGAASSGQANSVWYRFTAPGNGTITADTLTSPYDTILNVTSGSPAGAQVACNNDAAAGIAQSQVSFPVTSGTTYFFMVSSFLGDGGTTNFHLTFSAGVAGVPASITATSGTPQNATISTAFAAPLVATVKDSFNNPVNAVVVTFTPPASGASGTFAGGVNTATTNSSGVATSAVFTANATAGGPYNVAATVAGVATPANFALTNKAGTAAKVAATSGTPQSASISTAFAAPLVATVTDSGNNPVSGVVVTFTPPASGASGTFAGGVNTATTNASGVATSAVFTANATAGGPYDVVASATGATSANFVLTNNGGAPTSVTATSGTPQSATISTAFAAPLVATVKDAGSNPVSGVVVTFTPPASGASGTFAGGVNTATTNASGVATSAVFTANATAGGPYNVVASATGATSANFSLTNNAGAAAKVAVTSGSGQSATISIAFAAPLVATITDSGNNPVSGVVVTFTAPASGASGTFAGGVKTATTNASGVATSAVFTANATAGGPYNVVASATGATSANFSLTNTSGAAAKVTATSGSGQNATISTAFAAPLVATVTDSGNNPVSGVVVTFTPPASGASGTFAGGVNTATTNASGVATSAVFTANATAGGPYNVVASAAGATSANFALTNKAGAAVKVAATSGTPQSAAISTAFAATLAATVTDAGNNPVSGVVVTFTPPASGASGTFAGGVNTATTNASGVATSAVFTANATAGGPYNVVASATGATSANFVLTNLSGTPTKIVATSGTPQSTTISTAFAAPLVATVTDAGNNPVSGVTVTFNAPASGASGTFAGGVKTATTNASGVATSAVFTANATAGAYTVTGTVAGVATPANFSLTNNAGAAASVTATSGTPQSATISTAFAAPLVATVKDAGSNPVSGVVVTFTPPASGASGTFAGGVNTATTNASGVATSVVFTANATAGGPYNVVANATGATSANFALTNNAGAAASITATSGTPQNTTISTAFAVPLVATVKDAGSNPVSGVVVTFNAPASGASGTFAGGVKTATTNASGVATSAVFTANATAGAYTVTATVPGVATPANFSLTNNAGAAAKVTATSGSGQNATISTAFASPLVATVTDAGNNPVSGVVVTFMPPASGASGAFAGGVNTATTNASGVATSVVFTANATAGGPYNVVASATGATSANFALTNKAGAAAKVTATSGTPQSATISTAFAAPLVATVTDAGNNPVSGVVVTFTAPASGASGTFAGGVNTATTNASGVATSAVFTANATAGGPYNVVASATGATSANFALTNKTGAAAKVAVTSGSGQSAAVNTAFGAPLVATVTDAGNNPVSGVVVTFTPPASGASGTFAGGVNTATTNASGVATSAVFTANATSGGPYNVVASATGATSANFSLTNTTVPPGKVAITTGSGQSATINTAFVAPLVATVTDAGNNPVSGVVVTFTPPASGASGTFAGGLNTATTNASGVATSATFTANATAGSYNVSASAPNDTPANFAFTNTAGPAAKVTATSGTPQSATINASFAAPLVATVTDAGNNPVSGVVVTFTPPASGAGGTFAGGVNTATTNASGVATSAPFTANSTAGGPYNVVASAAGATSTNFALTNTAGPAAKVTASSGSGQSATISTAFAATLVATVTDAGNNPVSGVVVTFTPPASGASGTFAGGVNTATTNASGVATSAVFTANSTAGGPYNVVASATGATSANFALTNKTGAAAKVTATSGTPQSIAISTAFAAPLVATVTDAGNNPVSGVVVTFTPPASGASGTFAGGVNTATTNASGVATSAVFTANATSGGPYNVLASATGATSANFSLTNLTGTPASVTATAGTPQGAAINTVFATALQATVKDAGSNPVSGVVVTFAAPGSGASGTFAGGVTTATTNASGVATAAAFTANGTVGAYTVTATVAGVVTPANFALTNNAGPAASITATAGTPQSAAINTAFATLLQATVKDAGNNPVSGVTVTFAAPTSGASGAFAGGVTTATTNASGVATAAAFTANATAGTYTVTAKVAGVATAANFSLTNNAGPAASITATAGTPQSATINTAFATLLQATVKDAGGNLVSGAIVTFAAPASGASGAFAGGVTTATTNASGVATAVVFTANGTAGTYNVTAKVGVVATAANFALTNNNPVPTVTLLAPTSANAGGAGFLLTITGTNFVSGATVTFGSNAAVVPATLTAVLITVNIPAADIATGGSFPVVVTNPAPGGGASAVGAASTFTVNNPVPTLASATVGGKTHAAGGAGFTVTVNGTLFVSTSAVNFNGKAEPTTFVNATQLTAAIPASDVATAGNVNITVANPAPGGGTTAATVFTVDGITVSGPANTPVKAGMVANITITVTPTILANGFANAVTFSVAGLPKNTTATFTPTSVTPNGAAATTTLMVTTKAGSEVPPLAPQDTPNSPLLRLIPVLWLAALLAGFAAMRRMRWTLPRRRYAAIVPLALLLVTGAVLAGCAGFGGGGTPKGAAQLSVTATSGTMSVVTAPNSVTLTVQ